MYTWHPQRWFLLIIFLCSQLALRSQSQPFQSEPNTTTAADSVITFNEIMYHPAGDDPALEWVELYNQMSVNMDISGWRIEGGIEYQFPPNTVFAADSYVIISSNPDRLRALTALTNIVGPFANRVSNSGETLVLRNQSGRLMDEMTYSDEDPWPVGADGSGASLSKRDRFHASSQAANWRGSAQAGGTPGKMNFEDMAEAEPVAISLVRNDSAARWTVPVDDRFGTSWTGTNFNDSSWAAGTAAMGYETGSTAPVELRNVASQKAVIDGSGAYANNPFDVPHSAGNFIAQNVTDGSTSDVFGENYWLGREGIINEYFTLDLGEPFQVEEIHLRNTHNTQHNDRGTGDFEIWASLSIDAGKELVNPVRILSGRLSDVMGFAEIPADVFTSANGLTLTNSRYLRFVALTANNPGNNVGLNDIEVYAPLITGPDRAYSFNGNLRDSSGAGLDGQNMGATFSTNIPPVLRTGQSIAFDGASQVQVLDTESPSAYTIAMWVNVETVQSSSIILRTGDGGTKSAWSHQLRINGSGRFEHYLFDGTGRAVMATNTIVPGVWNHVAIKAKSNGAMQIWINGAQSGESTAVNAIWPEGNQWRLGSDAGNAPNFFRGRVDDLAIWHKDLDPASIQALAAGRSPTQLGGFRRFFSTDVQDALFEKNGSAFLRIPFENPSRVPFGQLTLNVRYADGFVAFLNGVEVARRNAPLNLSWNSIAPVNRADLEAINIDLIDLTPHASAIVNGGNVLAVQALNSSISDPGFLFAAELVARPTQFGATSNIAFSEIAAVGSTNFFIELENFGEIASSLAGCALVSSSGTIYSFGSNSLPAHAYSVITRGELGFALQDGDRVFLLGPGNELIDAVEIHNRTRGRRESGIDAPWFYTSSDTPRGENTFTFRNEIVINEIMYHHRPRFRTEETPFVENPEQWIELYNTATVEVDLTGWRLDGEVGYAFPAGTRIAANSYLVVAKDAVALKAKYPDIAAVGNFERRLARNSGQIILRDPTGNPADEVRYYNSHPWSSYANGGGSSLELRDPRSDNGVAQAWGPSSENAKAPWRNYTYRAAAVRPLYTPGIFNFHEFRMGLLDEGEALIDNITVTELPSGAPSRQLLQNSTFENGTQHWRLLGNHSHSTVVERDGNSADSVLHLVATGNTSYLDNRLETTLKSGATYVPVVTGREYEISFDAKWIAGSPQLRTELYYNKVAATTILETHANCGTPGQRNSIYTTNAGPTYVGLSHSPIVPRANEPIRISISAMDPDEVRQLEVFYSVNGGAWQSIAMSQGDTDYDIYEATLPGQVNGTVIQFYVEGTDRLGVSSTYPARGAASRALIKVDSARLVGGKQTFRTIMTSADSSRLHSAINMMSDDLLGCTVVHHEREVFYDSRIRLHGSMFSRNDPSRVGLTVKFPADHLFRGSRESVIVRRRGLVETLVKHILNSAGGIPGNYDDVVHLVSHRSDNFGTARMNLANYDDTYVESQFEGDDDGTVFKLEGIREYQTTQNGSPEGLKLSQPIGWIQGFDIANFGDDPEQYRWGIMIQSDRKRDDYSRIVAMGKAFSLSGTALKQAAGDAIDVDQWARLFALQRLLGIADVYGVENPHNFAFYVRPSDGRVVGLQNDWEFAFGLSTSASINGSKNVYKVLRLPGFQRVYQGHLLDLLDSVVNPEYLTPWAQHYTRLTGESYNNVPSYVGSRGASVRNQLAARIPFEILSNNGVDYSVNTASVTLQGRGWIDVHKIYRNGEMWPLEVTWIDDQRWQVTLPLAPGINNIQLTAENFRGVQVGSDTISIATTSTEFPQQDHLRITEVMYHPAQPNAAELAAGYTDEGEFEFIELLNTGQIELSLLGVKFTAGITFDFTNGSITNLAPSGRVLLVKNIAAFQMRYGTDLPVAGEYDGSLSNSGELLRLVDALGGVIQEFTFGDGGAWPEGADGGGRSLDVRDPQGNYNDPTNWQVSPEVGGSPGAAATLRSILGAIAISDGEVRISFEAAAGVTYEVLATSDLTAGQWSSVRTISAEPTSRIEVVTDAPAGNTRFYRIRSF